MSGLLPRPRARKVCTALLTVAMACAAGCKQAPPPVAPGEPIPAEPDVIVGTMAEECGALVGAMDTWNKCRNLDERGHDEVAAWREAAAEGTAAADKAKPDEKAQHAIAVACHRAITSVRAATERCGNGKPVPQY